MDDQIGFATEEQRNLQQAGEKLAPDEFTEEASGFSDCKSFDVDDILDLAGGAKDAIERHRSKYQILDETNANIRNSGPGKEEADAEAKALSSLFWDLLYWRDVQKTACVFGATLSLLISLSLLSVISVCSYIALALLSVTICFRIYSGFAAAVQKAENMHPFKLYLEQEETLPADILHRHRDVLLKHINASINRLKHLFLVEDLLDSLKFAVVLWVLTYVGSVFNGLTVLIIGDVAAFTCPVFYEKHKVQIDHYYELVKSYIQDVMKKIQAKIHGLKIKIE
ncbi:reticulon-3-like [Neoarius graeffei]|uniref:reticulon-3-like n=1 Tax=Neoarius graeffei TaxID=443677 RepID=UPI00298D3CFC|nr:reticulon-3-like [Neoarius graeffei]